MKIEWLISMALVPGTYWSQACTRGRDRSFFGFFVVRKDRSLVAYWKTTKKLQQIYGSIIESWSKTWKHHLNFCNSARCNMDLSHKSFDLVVWIHSFAGTKDHFGASYASGRVPWCTNLVGVPFGCLHQYLGLPWFESQTTGSKAPIYQLIHVVYLYPGMQINLQQQQNCGRWHKNTVLCNT